jgi:GIY-YIG catalytic domain/NUMOD1 domain
LLTGQKYCGSSCDIGRRFIQHLNLSNKSTYISRALALHGPENFDFSILEYCRKEILLEREQHYLDSIQPEYNILKKAGSPLGIKQSEESKEKIRQIAINRSPEVKAIDLLKLKKAYAVTSQALEVTNITTNEQKYYRSIRQAAAEIGITARTIGKYLKNQNVYNNYIFTL